MNYASVKGQALDILVAEKVMGWKRLTYAQQYSMRAPHTHKYSDRNELTDYWHSEELDSWGTIVECAVAEDCDDYYAPESAWSPSTDIAAAWEVVEHLHAQGLRFSIYEGLRAYDEPRWNAAFHFSGGRDDGDDCHAETAPRAICLAALKAVGVTP